MASDQFDITKAVGEITSWPPGEEQTTAAKELLRHLSQTLIAPAQISSEMGYAIVMDTGVEPLLEILLKWLPLEWQLKTTCRLCDRLSDVVKFMQEAPPALLVIHSNLFIPVGEEAISALVAVSPGTRYLVITGHQPFVAPFQQVAGCLPVSVHTIIAPFSRDQFTAALSGLSGA
jgi:hypothetical protein